MIRVLYVDDEPDLLEIGKLYLEETGDFSILTMESALLALESFKKERFDVVVADYRMPVMDGVEFLKHIRDEGNDIPFIILTGRGHEEIVIEALNNGADFYLQKKGEPVVQFAELRRKILSAIEHHHAKEAIKTAEETYRNLFLNSQIGLFRLDVQTGLLLDVNDTLARFIGFQDRALMLGKSFSIVERFVDPSDHEKIISLLKADGEFQNYETRLRKDDGSIIWLRVSGRLIREKGWVEGVSEDITERKRAEEALQESELFNRNLIENLPDFIGIIAPDGKILYLNPPATEVLGYTMEEIIGTSVFNYVAEDYRDIVALKMASRSGEGKVTSYEIDVLSRDGFRIPVIVNGTQILYRDVNALLLVLTNITERKKAEEAFKESNRKYAELFELGGDAVFLIDNETGSLLEANAAAGKLYGYPKEVLLTMKNTDLSAEKEETQKITTGSPQGTIHVPIRYHRRNDGTVFPVEIVGQFFTWKGRQVHIASVRDISERRRTEEALAVSHDRFEQINAQSREMVWEVDADGLYTYVSHACYDITGFEPEELIGKKHFYDLHPKEGLEEFAASILNDFARRKVFLDFIHFLQTKDGKIVWMSTNGMPFFDEYNNFLGYRGSDSDITVRKQAEEMRTRFGRILESSLNEIYFFDAQTLRFVDVNHGARENLGYTMDELSSMTPVDLTTEYTKESFEELIAPLRTGEKERQVVFTVYKRKDGSLYPVEMHLQFSKNEIVPVFVAIVLDITERRQTEEALRLANWKLNLLSGITRHDINNQMTVLRGYLDILEMEQTDPFLKDYIQKMETSAKRISSMIQFTKEYEEIGITVPVWQDISSLVTTAAKEISFGEIQLKNDLPTCTEVFAEPLIFKVFYNLMDNAVRYGDKITTIRFSGINRSGDWVIVCEDDGVGIHADEKEKIFLRGFGKNTGLGLALTLEILEITGISIEETGEPGKGARFEITVPKGMWRFTGHNK